MEEIFTGDPNFDVLDKRCRSLLITCNKLDYDGKFGEKVQYIHYDIILLRRLNANSVQGKNSHKLNTYMSSFHLAMIKDYRDYLATLKSNRLDSDSNWIFTTEFDADIFAADQGDYCMKLSQISQLSNYANYDTDNGISTNDSDAGFATEDQDDSCMKLANYDTDNGILTNDSDADFATEDQGDYCMKLSKP